MSHSLASAFLGRESPEHFPVESGPLQPPLMSLRRLSMGGFLGGFLGSAHLLLVRASSAVSGDHWLTDSAPRSLMLLDFTS
jgi:hypothetical protein